MTDYRRINSLFNQQTTYPACRLSNKIWRTWPRAPNESAAAPSPGPPRAPARRTTTASVFAILHPVTIALVPLALAVDRHFRERSVTIPSPPTLSPSPPGCHGYYTFRVSFFLLLLRLPRPRSFAFFPAHFLCVRFKPTICGHCDRSSACT